MIRFFLTVSLITIQVGCNGSGVMFNAKKSSIMIDPNQNLIIPPSEDDFVGSIHKLDFESLSEVSMSKFIEEMRKKLTNEPVEAAESIFYDLKDFSDRNDYVYQEISILYQTLGDYFNALGVDSFSEIFSDKVEEGYEKLASIYESGRIDSLLIGIGKGSDSKRQTSKSIFSENSLDYQSDDRTLKKWNDHEISAAAIALLIVNTAKGPLLLDSPNGEPAQNAGGQEMAQGGKWDQIVDIETGDAAPSMWPAGGHPGGSPNAPQP